jgi:hypothetical protein
MAAFRIPGSNIFYALNLKKRQNNMETFFDLTADATGVLGFSSTQRLKSINHRAQ